MSGISKIFDMSLTTKLGLSAFFGVLCHVLFFIRGEHHTQPPMIVRIYALLFFLVYLFERSGNEVLGPLYSAFLVLAAHVTGLLTSIVIYRVFFHRLKSFPGPPLGKISKIWHVTKILDRRNHLYLDSLRVSYGNYVRTGMHC
jgi:hypothetical protein